MITTIMTGFFGALSLISIIANIRFEKETNRLVKEIEKITNELEQEIEKNLIIINRPIFNSIGYDSNDRNIDKVANAPKVDFLKKYSCEQMKLKEKEKENTVKIHFPKKKYLPNKFKKK